MHNLYTSIIKTHFEKNNTNICIHNWDLACVPSPVPLIPFSFWTLLTVARVYITEHKLETMYKNITVVSPCNLQIKKSSGAYWLYVCISAGVAAFWQLECFLIRKLLFQNKEVYKMASWTILQASIHKLQRNLLMLQILMQDFQNIFIYCLDNTSFIVKDTLCYVREYIFLWSDCPGKCWEWHSSASS